MTYQQRHQMQMQEQMRSALRDRLFDAFAPKLMDNGTLRYRTMKAKRYFMCMMYGVNPLRLKGTRHGH